MLGRLNGDKILKPYFSADPNKIRGKLFKALRDPGFYFDLSGQVSRQDDPGFIAPHPIFTD